MGTRLVLAIPFPPCLSRKRQSWDHGVRLRIPFPLACQGKGSRGMPTIRFSPCQSRKRIPAGLRRAPWLGCTWGSGLSFDRQGEKAITGTLVRGVVQDCLFNDRQREKGWRVPRGNPFSASVLSMLRPREALFPRQAEGKRHLERGSAGEASVGKQSFPKHRRSKHAQTYSRRISSCRLCVLVLNFVVCLSFLAGPPRSPC